MALPALVTRDAAAKVAVRGPASAAPEGVLDSPNASASYSFLSIIIFFCIFLMVVVFGYAAVPSTAPTERGGPVVQCPDLGEPSRPECGARNGRGGVAEFGEIFPLQQR